ncbi:MAG: hypothetical protein A3A97_01475 [Candidatus Terrybacteria bacterium RIFCSPLOWO2_01_FULL_40_23]|uniref:Uncharacterized protein n=1 Tax=Candidatus Terrybacteria bacterium RIFCSPLOWO2_01_FULL_40_23 TaxID=1802366 RepID=A0A1G2PVI5_9BACT|nr:MAG: hypothetical protein A3A97_01475 [Candidatus Terrybacteria bacterium RIFCSPLOWO2_01_FULL_40_23]
MVPFQALAFEFAIRSAMESVDPELTETAKSFLVIGDTPFEIARFFRDEGIPVVIAVAAVKMAQHEIKSSQAVLS